MWIQQVFAALLCVLFVSHDIKAVVNNAQANVKSENESNSTKSNENADDSSNLNNVADSVASSSDPEANRRDAPLSISDSYGAPLGDTYLPPEPSNIGLPQPVYGVPNAPTNNIVYPAPPPDIPPPLPSKPVLFNPAGDFNTYGPPKENNIHLKENFRPPPLPPLKYGPPSLHQRLPKPFPPFPFNHQKGPKQHFAPSLQSKPHFKPKPLYGPPKIQFRPPKPPKSNYGPPKFVNSFGLSPPKGNYGPPKFNQGIRYGPPDPVPHGPPHPGAPAPPTPPDIKYDGWQPIPGLVSRPPSSTYGVPNNNHAVHGDLQLNADFSPPHLDTSYNSFGSAISQQSLFLGGNGGFPADSYGAPLNAVTGSGDLISDQGHEEHPGLSIGLASVGLGNNHDDSLSVVKSIGYEIYLNNNGGFGDAGVGHAVQDTYSAPPLNSYSPDGPYAAAHSYNSNGVSFDSNLNSHSGLSLSSSGIGLIPPSGVYGVPPSGSYGTPLLGSVQQHGHALNALEINPPKHPVIFREPVPNGLIESIGNHVAQKDAHGIIEHSSSYTGGPTYIPPPVPDLTKPVNEDHLPEPSNLFSLPANDAPVSFQNVVHDTSVASSGLGSYATNLGHHSDASALASFGVPFSTIDGSYGETVALDTSHAATSIDLTSLPLSYGVPTIGNYHDCSLHKSQPLPLPQLSYGVPSANSYTASLSSLTTNIGGLQNHHHQDLQAAHSQKQSVAANVIGQSQVKDSYGKALIKNNLDLNNIPIQGALGSYTLQIQPADSLGSSSSPHVPHEQLLNDGLLRSILAAIENPRQKLQQQQQQQQQQQLQQLQQQQLQLQPQLQQQQYVELQQPPSQAEEIEAQDSAKNLVVVTPSPDNELVNAHKNDSNEVELDENEIALYFNNSQNKRNSDESVISEESSKDSSDKVLNGQQYGGSFVSFKTPKSSFSYGDLNMAQKDAEVKT